MEGGGDPAAGRFSGTLAFCTPQEHARSHAASPAIAISSGFRLSYAPASIRLFVRDLISKRGVAWKGCMILDKLHHDTRVAAMAYLGPSLIQGR